MATANSTASQSNRNPYDPETGIRPGESWMVDGLDWSWAFVWFQEVPECPGYWIGSNGSLWSFRDNSGKPKDRCRLMKLSAMKTGHLKKHLTDANMKRRMFYIHSLVNSLFNTNRPEGMVCRHRDGNPTNNHYWNLEWGTVLDNIRDRDLVHRTTARGTAYPHAKLDEAAIADMYDMCEAGALVKDIAAKYDMDESQTCKILKGEMWSHAVQGRIPPLKGVDGRKRAWRLDPSRFEAVSRAARERWEKQREFLDPLVRLRHGGKFPDRQIDAVFMAMMDGEWHTFAELELIAGVPSGSVSQMLGRLRTKEFGSHQFEKRRSGEVYPSPWEYRLVVEDRHRRRDAS